MVIQALLLLLLLLLLELVIQVMPGFLALVMKQRCLLEKREDIWATEGAKRLHLHHLLLQVVLVWKSESQVVILLLLLLLLLLLHTHGRDAGRGNLFHTTTHWRSI